MSKINLQAETTNSGLDSAATAGLGRATLHALPR